jgi:hypothetical protein
LTNAKPALATPNDRKRAAVEPPNDHATRWLARLAGETPCIHRIIASSGECRFNHGLYSRGSSELSGRRPRNFPYEVVSQIARELEPRDVESMLLAGPPVGGNLDLQQFLGLDCDGAPLSSMRRTIDGCRVAGYFVPSRGPIVFACAAVKNGVWVVEYNQSVSSQKPVFTAIRKAE